MLAFLAIDGDSDPHVMLDFALYWRIYLGVLYRCVVGVTEVLFVNLGVLKLTFYYVSVLYPYYVPLHMYDIS